MADIWYDVDTALSEVPVNKVPLIDDGDFKTIEGAVAYDAAGMALFWHFVTTAGAYTVTAVTPTTGGNYDWTDQGSAGVYTIEMPASGGASINNDTEGFGWFTGVATGILPWTSPIYGFRAAALNNALIDGNASAQFGLDFSNVNIAVGAVDALGWLENGTMQAGSAAGTAVLRSATSLADDLIIGSTIFIRSGTGAGQSRIVYDWVSATDTASVSPNWTTTPDNTSVYAVVPTPPAPTNAAALPAVNLTAISGDAQSATDLKDFADAGYDPSTNKVQGVVLTDTVTTYTGNTVQTGDSFARLGAPAGASVSADIAVIESQTDDIGVAGAGLTALATAAALATVDGIVDTLVSGVITGAAATGTLSTTQATTSLTGYANDQLIGRVIIWLTGNCEGEATRITDYASASGLLTFTALTTAPANTDTFKIV